MKILLFKAIRLSITCASFFSIMVIPFMSHAQTENDQLYDTLVTRNGDTLTGIIRLNRLGKFRDTIFYAPHRDVNYKFYPAREVIAFWRKDGTTFSPIEIKGPPNTNSILVFARLILKGKNINLYETPYTNPRFFFQKNGEKMVYLKRTVWYDNFHKEWNSDDEFKEKLKDLCILYQIRRAGSFINPTTYDSASLTSTVKEIDLLLTNKPAGYSPPTYWARKHGYLRLGLVMLGISGKPILNPRRVRADCEGFFFGYGRYYPNLLSKKWLSLRTDITYNWQINDNMFSSDAESGMPNRYIGSSISTFKLATGLRYSHNEQSNFNPSFTIGVAGAVNFSPIPRYDIKNIQHTDKEVLLKRLVFGLNANFDVRIFEEVSLGLSISRFNRAIYIDGLVNITQFQFGFTWEFMR